MLGWWVVVGLAWAGGSDTERTLDTAGAALDAGAFDDVITLVHPLDGARARLLEAVAQYELGELRAAERLAAAGLAIDPSDAGLLVLHGLVLADLGRGDEAIGPLAAAISSADRAGDAALGVRARLHRGLVDEDQGHPERARTWWTEARTRASAAALPDLAAEATALLAGLDVHGATDLVGRVADALRRGDTAAAHGALEASRPGRRGATRAAIARGMVARADGRLDDAADLLKAAVVGAEAGGLLREASAARLELAQVLVVGGAVDEARTVLADALQRVGGSSLAVREADLRLALGRLEVRAGHADAAAAQLEAVRRVVAGLDHPAFGPAVRELGGMVRAAQGAPADGSAELLAASAAWTALGFHADAARAGAEAVRTAAVSGRGVDAARAVALAAFEAAHDPRGPIHVALSAGLGATEARRTDEALAAFAEALRRARAVDDARLVAVAEHDLAEALVVLGHDRGAVDGLSDEALQDAVARHARFLAARKAFDAGRRAFDAGQWSQARTSFSDAVRDFDGLGEERALREARRGRAWSTYNLAVASEPLMAVALLDGLAGEGEAVGDGDLSVRVEASGAIAAGRAGVQGAASRLRAAAPRAVAGGMPGLAARCWAGLSELPIDLDDRVAAARSAFRLDPKDVGAWAVYGVAVAAYRADALELARTLVDEVGRQDGELGEGIDALRRAATEALGVP
ncbi:MAG: hypothetical protein H6733_15870 [Alphaproteobacteria bacterium]|nr:hypothetical protein [Alphaproteobacteria bacterium]